MLEFTSFVSRGEENSIKNGRGDLVVIFQYLKGAYKRNRDKFAINNFN